MGTKLRWALAFVILFARALAHCLGAEASVKNLALAGMGARARSWEPGVHSIAGHEPSKANDGSLHSYWAVAASDLPADLGIEWAAPQKIAAVVVRYFDGRMVRGPAMARTQQWARVEYWIDDAWKDVHAQLIGQETSSARYTFAPVTTRRLRLLFGEPPDPESRRAPDDLGVYVCELEAYSEPPFQVVSPGARLVKLNRPEKNYNEWGSDNSYDLAGPLVIEPKQTKVFQDVLSPTLIVSESRWAQSPCEVPQTRAQKLVLKNGFLQLELSTAGVLRETALTNLVTGESVATSNATGFRIRTSAGELTSADFKIVRTDASGSTSDASKLRIDLSSTTSDASLYLKLRRQDHFYHKWLTLTNKSSLDLRVLDVTVSSLGLSRLFDLMAGPELTYPIYRMSKGGFFQCLETVYWDHLGDSLTYYPGARIGPGMSFESAKAVVGIYRSRGEEVERFDAGVRDWVIEYHAQVSPLAKEWPDVYLEGWSAKFGMEELEKQPKWAEQFFSTAHAMGIRYMDAYEPTDLALLMPTDSLRRWMDLANRYEIGTGWWNDFGSSYGWGFMVPYLEPYMCKLSPEAEDYFGKILDLVKTYHLRGFHWADFWTVWPCDNPNHGHLPGIYSIYAQGQRMIRFNQQMHEASPGLMLGADSGLDNPQYGRFADSRHHGGGWDSEPSVEPDIHLDRLYADMNRDYLYSLAHETLLRPWFRLLNCVNHFGMETHRQDSAGYRYALLSALALAPQLTFNDAPDDIPESDLRFTRQWEDWATKSQDYLKEGEKLFDRSLHFEDVRRGGDQSLTGYSHIRGDRGYVFLINPDVVEHIAELSLELAATGTQKFTVADIYPGGMTLQGPEGGSYSEGGTLRVTVPARQVRILWISPTPGTSAPGDLQPENARLGPWRRYIGQWTVTSQNRDSATLRARFEFPSGAKPFLTGSDLEPAWSREPWNFAKAYLLLILKDETKASGDNWVPDGLSLTASVNGVSRHVYTYKTVRRQDKGMTRCYFFDLECETKPGEDNEVEIHLPIERGLVFSGAYLDLPDQVPLGATPGA